jgi:hypothetical protein
MRRTTLRRTVGETNADPKLDPRFEIGSGSVLYGDFDGL